MVKSGEFSAENAGEAPAPSPLWRFLRDTHWTSSAPFEKATYRDAVRLNEILILPTDTPLRRATKPAALAYYTLELATGLKPISTIDISQPLTPESKADYQAFAVYSELMEAARLYMALRETDDSGKRIPDHNKRLHLIQRNIKAATHQMNPRNNSTLGAMERLKTQTVGIPEVSPTLAHDAEYVLRMFLAREQNKIDNYLDLESVFFASNRADL